VKSIIRLEIIIDGLSTDELLTLIQPFSEVTCTIHRATACQSRGNTITGDDLSDSLSSNLVILFFPEALYPKLQKALVKKLTSYAATVYESKCNCPSWL